MKSFRAFGVVAFCATACLADTPVVGEGPYRSKRDTLRNLDAYIRAVDAETNGCVVATPAPCGFKKDDPARVKWAAVADDLFKLCDNRRVWFLDTRKAFLNADGSLKAELYEPDGLALNAAGRAKFAEAVKPLADWVACPTSEPAPCTKFGWKHFYSGNVHLMRAGRHWWWDRVMRCHAQAERLRKTRGGRLDVLLIGDSITHHWEDSGASFYDGILEGREVMNLANGGDLTYQQLWLVRNGLIDGLQAQLVQILIGTNDHDDAQKKFARIGDLVEAVRAKMPQAKILLCPILPRLADKDADERRRNEDCNKLIRGLCDGRKTVYFDFGEPMRRVVGAPEAERRKLAGDLLHPSPIMYRHWLDCLKPYLPKPSGDVRPTRHVTAFAIGKTREKGNYASADLNAKLAAAVAQPMPATHVYLRYRTRDPDLKGLLITRTKDESYHSNIGFVPDGEAHDAVILLEGWSRSGRMMAVDPGASFVFKLDGGAIDLIEVGVVR